MFHAKVRGMDIAIRSIDFDRLTDSMTSLPVTATLAASAICMIVAGTPAGVNVMAGPSTADRYAAVGAVLAVIIVLVAVRQFQKSFMNMVSVFIGTVVMGVCVPGIVVSFIKGSDADSAVAYEFLEWKIWLLLGFVCGLSGWTVTQTVYNLFTKLIPSAVESVARRFFSKWLPPDDKPPTL